MYIFGVPCTVVVKIIITCHLINITESIRLMWLSNNCEIPFVELWNRSDLSSTGGEYYRNTLIEDWENNPPIDATIDIKNKLGQRIADFRFDITGASRNLTSWMTYDRLIAPRPNPFQAYVPLIRNGSLYFIKDGNTDVYLLAAEIVNMEGILFNANAISTSGHGFSLDNGYVEGQSIFWTSQYTNDTAVTFVSIDLRGLGIWHFVNGIAVKNTNDSVTYQLAFNQYTTQSCDPVYRKNISDTYTFPCNGVGYGIPSITPACMWIYFSQPVYNFTVNLTEPETGMVMGYKIGILAKYAENQETTTVTIPHTDTTTANQCPCQCDDKENVSDWTANKTSEEIQTVLENFITQTKKELSVNKNNLSSSIRKKTCAPDNRPSATSAGALGAVIIAVVLASFVCIDFHQVYVTRIST